MNDKILIVKTDFEVLLNIFEKCRAAFTGDTATSVPSFENFAMAIYPSIHNMYYYRRILAPEDHAFVAAETSEELFDFQWQTPDPSALALLQAEDRNKVQISRHEVRLLYLLLEDLNQFFHQPGYFQTTESIQAFYLRCADRLAHSIAVLRTVCESK